MRYEAMGKARRQRLNVPQLLGGVNTATEAEFIEDDELADACNLRIDHGALCTREAVRAVGNEPIESQSGAYTHIDGLFPKPIEIDGKTCAVTALGKNDSSDSKVITLKAIELSGTVSQTGEVFRTYTANFANANGTIYPQWAVAPYKETDKPYQFLLYHNGNVYIPDDTAGTIAKADEESLYAPLVMINGRSLAAGTQSSKIRANGVMYEGYNLLASDCYRASFTPSMETGLYEYYPAPKNKVVNRLLVSVEIEIVTPEKTVTCTIHSNDPSTTFTLNGTTYTANLLVENETIQIGPPLPVSDVTNTVTITYRNDTSGSLPVVSLATWFGGTANKRGGTRLFLADTDNAKLLWSDVNNPFYFPENNYMIVGDSSQTITALEKQSDMLVIFKEREIYYTTYVQGEIDTDAVANGTNVDVTAVQAYFPLTQLSPQIGCRCPHSIALCRDRLVWMDEDARIYTLVVSGQYSERNVREIGQKIRPWLLKKTTVEQRRNASAIDHNGKYRLMVGNVMAEFDYNDSGFVNVSSYYSGERAARNIAWMTHQYNFDQDAVQTLVSDGADKAIIISTAAEDDRVTRTLYHFDAEEDKDRYLTPVNDGMQAREKEIDVSLTTKTYEFGDPAAYKRIHALYPMLQTDDAEITVIVDGAEPPYGRRYKSADTFAHLVLPGISRCRTFALKLKAIGKLCLKGLRMEYSIFGNVK